MTGCRARLEMLDGPRGPFGRLSLAGAPEAVAYAQWLLGQRLSAAASFQLGGTTYYSYSPPNGMGVGMAPGYAPAPPAPLPFMPAPWGGAPHMGLSPMGPAALQQQQQHMMAAAAAAQSMAQAGMAGGMMPGPGVMPMPMPLRQGSGASGTSTPDAPLG